MSSDAGRNYFELFGLPVSFEIDRASLTERYRDLQRTVHPDKYANATDRERRLSVQQASLINEAFETLKSPLGRARYLLELHGLAVNDESNTVMDPVFLMQQMEWRESLEDIAANKDFDGLAAFIDDVSQQRKGLVNELKTFFADVDEEALKQAHSLTLQMQFLDKLITEAENLEETML
jgi:molecular chaperone HscB